MKEEFHCRILKRLAEFTRTAGLELLCTSSNYETTEKLFSRTLRMLYSLYTYAAEDLIPRPRAESMPTGVRSRMESTSNRLLRTLTTSGAQKNRNFKSTIEHIDESLSSLWNSLEQWFLLVKDEIHRIPSSPTDSTSNQEDKSVEKGNLSTRMIASELVRSKPKNISSDRRSIASMESIRLSQPALEFNIAKMNEDLNSSVNLSRSLGRMLYNRSISANNRDSSDEDDEANQIDYDSVNLGDSMAQGGTENVATASDEHAPNCTAENGAPAKDSAPSREQPSMNSESMVSELPLANFGTQENQGSLSESNNQVSHPLHEDLRLHDHALSRRSISYTNAITQEPLPDDIFVDTDIPAMLQGVELDEDTLSPNDSSDEPVTPLGFSPFMDQTRVDSRPDNADTTPIGSAQQTYSDIATSGTSEVLKTSMTSQDDATANGNVTEMVKKVSDRLCAVIHGYHLASFKRPFWESDR